MTLKRRYTADIYINTMCIAINTSSGYGLSILDDKGREFILPKTTPEADIGNALREAIQASRWVLAEYRNDVAMPVGVEIDPDLYDLEKSKTRYEAWKQRLLDFCGCSKAKLFKPMYSISAELIDDVLTLSPSKQVKPEAWDGVDADIEIKIDINSSNELIGKAVSETLTHCESKFQK